ncbi:hypothetical protein AVEN_75281-1 [Araneus ventricosus]|uniref:Uncharacterized protein n=1 Tax=Araneus ventricosus TaxID=182803 RepID=A0A4Y2NM30_ARAVE|nr:hypothetical protein AVEN_75281-1 [Araneus ventricosus]
MIGFGLKDDSSYKNGNKLNKDKMCTAASLLSTSVTAEKLCVFFSGKHESTNCSKAQKMFYSEKLKILKDKGCCFKCLKAGHRVGKCRCFVKCLICNKMYYAKMCTESNQNKSANKSTSNSSEKEIKEQNKAVNLASISKSPQVLLQTLKVKIKSKNCSLTVRAMYDSGSQKSYIRKEIASVLGLAPLRQQLLSHALFGEERINEELHNVYKIELGSLDGNFNCNFDVVDKDIICNDVPSVSYGPWIDELKSMNIQMFDIEANLGPIDVLIGADVAGRLFTGKRRVLSSGLLAMESYLGWTIMGKTNLPSEKEDTAMMVISMFVREATISDLFSLEVLGISDPAEMKPKGSTSEEEEIEEAEFDSDSRDLTDNDRLHAPEAHEKESTSFEDERKEQLIAETLERSENEELQIPEGSNEEMIRLGIVDKESITEKEETSEEELEEKEDEEEKIDTIPDERKLLEEIVEELKSETDRHGLTEEERHQILDEIEQHTEIPKIPRDSVKTIAIPRLELLAATVGARLCRSVLSALQWDNVKQHYWTDSTTMLDWIQREELWSVFVNNRVQEIRKLTDPTLWELRPGAQNPSDLPSRGCSADQLSCSRWWEGPIWLLQTQENWPVTKPVFDEQSVLKERRKQTQLPRVFHLYAL